MAKQDEKKADKETQTVPVLVNFPVGLLEKIDQYQVDNYLTSRTASIFELIRGGLGELQRKK